MLTSDNRLKRKDFDRIKKTGKLIQSEDFGIVYIRNKEKTLSKFGFVVSTKVSKDAVNRNRVKRAMREAVRRNLNLIPTGYEVIFLTKTSITKKTTDEIMQQTVKAIKTLSKVK